MAGEIFERVRGDTIKFKITCSRPDVNGVQQLIDLTGAEITCTIKAKYSDVDGDALVQVESPFTSGSGVDILDQTTYKGEAQVIIAAGVTSVVEPGSEYYIDVQVEEADGTVTTPVDGVIKFRADVTITVP